MTQNQVRADQHEASVDTRATGPGVPDDQRTSSKPLRHSTGKERAFRDRGWAHDSDNWRAHKRREAD